jgi:hypothetical protein
MMRTSLVKYAENNKLSGISERMTLNEIKKAERKLQNIQIIMNGNVVIVQAAFIIFNARFPI